MLLLPCAAWTTTSLALAVQAGKRHRKENTDDNEHIYGQGV
jgi:hypothetical protein